jgi:hypothetical protein
MENHNSKLALLNQPEVFRAPSLHLLSGARAGKHKTLLMAQTRQRPSPALPMSNFRAADHSPETLGSNGSCHLQRSAAESKDLGLFLGMHTT